MRARSPNTYRRTVVARAAARRGQRAAALALALAVAFALAGCSGGSQGADTLLAETFRSHKPIESGRISLSFAVAGTGGQSLALRIEGPFASRGSGRLPDFALQVALSASQLAGGHAVRAGLTSTGGQLYIGLAGTYFQAPAQTVQALEQGYAHATRSSSASSAFSLLGVEPGAWLVDPRVAGSEQVGGAETTHVTAGLDTARFLADAERLSGAGEALGLGASGVSALLSPADLQAISGAVRSARVDVYTGAGDHLLRRISLTATLGSDAQTRAALGALSGATLTLTLQFSGLNQPQTIAAPSNTQPISGLLPALEQLGVLLGSQPAR